MINYGIWLFSKDFFSWRRCSPCFTEEDKSINGKRKFHWFFFIFVVVLKSCKRKILRNSVIDDFTKKTRIRFIRVQVLFLEGA